MFVQRARTRDLPWFVPAGALRLTGWRAKATAQNSRWREGIYPSRYRLGAGYPHRKQEHRNDRDPQQSAGAELIDESTA
jgi:hypothetical protein